jgi:hypothetical protein
LKKVVHDLLTTKYTEVYHEDPEQMKFNAPDHFVVMKVRESIREFPESVGEINFQEGRLAWNTSKDRLMLAGKTRLPLLRSRKLCSSCVKEPWAGSSVAWKGRVQNDE